FPGDLAKVRLPFKYQLSLLLVALAMILLPGIYLGFMAATAWGAWWWATHAWHWLFPMTRGVGYRISFLFLLAYITPLAVGLILLFFMFKCFFSRWRVVEFA